MKMWMYKIIMILKLENELSIEKKGLEAQSYKCVELYNKIGLECSERDLK